MPRSIWSGSISFGLVNVPVKLFTAVRKRDIRFHQLHAKDGVRIQQKRVCPADGEEVAYDDLVKGYEISPGQYVLVEPEELEALDPVASRTIDIEDFVELAEIDPLYFDSSYYIVPDERGGKAYRLLQEALEESGKVGIARVVMRTKQYLVAVRPIDGALVMTTMNFFDEVMAKEELDGLPDGRTQVSDRELAVANQLIESLATEFDPEKYHDDYRERVEDLIDQKAKGQEIVAQPQADKPAPVIDLMAALEASLAAAKGGKPLTAAARAEEARDAAAELAVADDGDVDGGDGDGADGGDGDGDGDKGDKKPKRSAAKKSGGAAKKSSTRKAAPAKKAAAKRKAS